MRKLNKKNKTYIASLSILAVILAVLVIIFIVYKTQKANTKYFIPKESYVYDIAGELHHLDKEASVQKDFIGHYYINYNDQKIKLGSNNVIYKKDLRNVILLGKFYEVKEDGEVEKINGITEINNTSNAHLYKISDRKYLIVSSDIKTSDDTLKTNDYLFVNIDRKGNGFLYNYENNIKTFNYLSLIANDLTFNVNEEILVLDGQEIMLNKINGSTNEYEKPEENKEKENENKNNGGNAGGTGQSEIIYPEIEPEIITEKIIEEKYLAHKTTIVNYIPTADSVTINYVAYDPFTEYKELYAEVYSNNILINKVSMNVKDTSVVINNLFPGRNYRVKFYYTYTKENVLQTVKFDEISFTTNDITGKIVLERVSENVVTYIVKVDGNYKLDSLEIEAYLDNELISKSMIDPSQASNAGYRGSVNLQNKSGTFVTIKVGKCIYNGAEINLNASYKFKI